VVADCSQVGIVYTRLQRRKNVDFVADCSQVGIVYTNSAWP